MIETLNLGDGRIWYRVWRPCSPGMLQLVWTLTPTPDEQREAEQEGDEP